MDDFEDDPLTTEEDCPAHEDGQHCSCWYEGYECCACGAPALEDE